MKYELLAGRHVSRNGVYDKGDIVESDLNLAKLYPAKFREVKDAIALVPEKSSSPPPTDEGSGDAKNSPPSSGQKSLEGEDVTNKFPLAEKITGLTIILKDAKYNVYDSGNKELLNTEPFTKEKSVNKFLKAFME